MEAVVAAAFLETVLWSAGAFLVVISRYRLMHCYALSINYKQNSTGRIFSSLMSNRNIVSDLEEHHLEREIAAPQVFSPLPENTITVSKMGFRSRSVDQPMSGWRRWGQFCFATLVLWVFWARLCVLLYFWPTFPFIMFGVFFCE